MLAWAPPKVEGPSTARLTAKEREVARLIGFGLTNRQIGTGLLISERTVDTHVQNILNKLGARNRAQIASWSTRTEGAVEQPRLQELVASSPGAPSQAVIPSEPITARRRPLRLLTTASVGLLVLLTIASVKLSSGAQGGHVTRGPLVYEARFSGDGAGFSSRYTIGDPSASAIRFLKGTTDYKVTQPGGNTGNSIGLAPMTSYFVEVQLSVEPGSDVEFWIDLTGPYTESVGHHLIGIGTQVSEMQLAYFHDQFAQPLGPPAPIEGLQNGRTFTVSAQVNPPRYTVYLNGTVRIDLQHQPNVEYQAPSFAVFGQGGTVHLSALRVYRLTSS